MSANATSSLVRYQELRAAGRVQERALFPVTREPSELELQARWFAGDFGRRFRSTCGRRIEVVQFGTWNRESGPDFTGAAIRVDDGEVRRGSIEFDLTDRSWESHGHSGNPAFEGTVLHVFVHAGEQAFFTRTLAHREVLQVRVDLDTLRGSFAANVPLARPGRCQGPLRGLSQERVESVLAGAAKFRLRRKAARLRALIDAHGRDDALFQELAAALGYKQNKLPFTLLAQRLSVTALGSSSDDAEALLFGVAGFLEVPDLSVYEGQTRTYLRTLWDRWWRHRDAMQRLVVPRELWRFGGARPLNHPQRRVGALATVASHWPAVMKCVGAQDPAAVATFLTGLTHPFWDWHYTLTSDRAAKQMALVGKSRAAEILANVLFPFWQAQQIDLWERYEQLPAQLTNRRVETAITRLFGDDPRRAQFVGRVAQQQGLLQIYEDFCLLDNSDCAHCPFPEQMQTWT